MLVAVAATAGCGDDSRSAGSGELTVVATTTQVAELVRQVGGERVNVEGMLRPGGDPHDYDPRPSDVAAVADSAVVFRSGGEVDDWLSDVIDNAGGDVEVVSLIDSVRRLDDDPHWWQDPRNGERAVQAIRAELMRVDPDGRPLYRRNAQRVARGLRRLDGEIAACVERVPPAKRKVVTTHDSLAYLARRYGIDVVGAVIPSLSTQAQASAGDVDRLVRQIRGEGVEAVFPESSVNPDIERAIAHEAGARVGDPLYADSLGRGRQRGGDLRGRPRRRCRRAGARDVSRPGGLPALAAAAGGALAAERHVVRVDRVVGASGQPLDRPLEVGVLEGCDLAAALAHDVMVVLAARADRLVAGDALRRVHAAGEPQLVEQLERPVDARDAHVLAAPVKAVGDLLGGDAAAEVGQRLDHRGARPAEAVALALELSLGMCDPFRHGVKDRVQGVRKAVHDLNNQLAVILNYTTFVLEDTPADDSRREDLLEVLNATKRARDIAQQLLLEQPPAD